MKTNRFKRHASVYANKLERFLLLGAYDKDTCVLLGVIATRSITRHTRLDDEIRTAIGSLRVMDVYGTTLIGMCRFQVESTVAINY